ncbi:MAG TPA: hypothetical protein VE693_11675 [Gaiellaceae bacterium]|jgi:hypothetical protein|nr:hypothetical protein [Gaiellaceae bacterium]
MPSRKQRRRREKLQRHEYEYVIETEEGEEVVIDRPKGDAAKDGQEREQRAPRDRRGREIPKPSLQRVLRRTAIFAPLILIVVFLTSGKDATTADKVFTAAVLLAFFIPFSYFVDVFMYRMFQRRQGARRGRG